MDCPLVPGKQREVGGLVLGVIRRIVRELESFSNNGIDNMPTRQKQSQRQTVIVNVGTRRRTRAKKRTSSQRQSGPAIMVQQVIPPIPLSVQQTPSMDFPQQFIKALAGMGEGIMARVDRPLPLPLSLNNPNNAREIQQVEKAMGKVGMPFAQEDYYQFVGPMSTSMGDIPLSSAESSSSYGSLGETQPLLGPLEEKQAPLGQMPMMKPPTMSSRPPGQITDELRRLSLIGGPLPREQKRTPVKPKRYSPSSSPSSSSSSSSSSLSSPVPHYFAKLNQ